ncbi:MAG: methyltransferase domain-containing protein [Lautropia sp.]
MPGSTSAGIAARKPAFSPGRAIRRVLGPTLARVVGDAYRAIFVDLDAVADAIAPCLPAGARVLDCGGGDGFPLNFLLARRPDLRITLVDPSASAGQWIDAAWRSKVDVHPGLTLAGYVERHGFDHDVILMSDVVHHLAPAPRREVFATIAALSARRPGLLLLVKDVEPGSPRALLGLWSDRYLTGDRDVDPIGQRALDRLVRETLGPCERLATRLHDVDPPNYAVLYALRPSASRTAR